MTTMTKNKFTKKYIQSVLRTRNQTLCFALFMQLHPEAKTLNAITLRRVVGAFIEENAPSKRVKKFGLGVIMDYDNPHQNTKWWVERYMNKYTSPLHEVIEFVKEQVTKIDSPYVKRPMLGFTHLYFCSPVYKHKDYNKWCALPIKGNEHFCDMVIKYADKFFAPVYDKNEN